MPNPATPALPAAVIAARKQAAVRLAGEAADAALNATIARTLAGRDDHPAEADTAAVREAEAADLAAKAKAAAKAAGVTPGIDLERIANLRSQLAEWKRVRAVHADMAANPDAYGYRDLGGAQLDPDAQARMVVEYDVAIAAVEADLAK